MTDYKIMTLGVIKSLYFNIRSYKMLFITYTFNLISKDITAYISCMWCLLRAYSICSAFIVYYF